MIRNLLQATAAFIHWVALAMVLLLGALPGHAEESVHRHVVSAVVASDAHPPEVGSDVGSEERSGPALHCGAPLVGLETLSLLLRVSVYSPYPTGILEHPSDQVRGFDPRPPPA